MRARGVWGGCRIGLPFQGDFAAYVDGVLIGFYGSYHAAEVACDQYTFTALTHQQAA
jgi:hypothetical protein